MSMTSSEIEIGKTTNDSSHESIEQSQSSEEPNQVNSGDRENSANEANDASNNEDVSTGDPDPLELRQLALSYDYLMYKIHDHVSGLCDATYGAVSEKQRRIQHEYFDEQLHLSTEKVRVEKMIESCKQLEMELVKLDQLGTFVGGFLERLEALEKGFAS